MHYLQIMANMSSGIESAKREAARLAVDEFIVETQLQPMIVGIGSGSTVVYAVERIAERLKDSPSLSLICIPSSFQATQLILKHGLTLGDLSQYPVIDVAIDGADEVDVDLNCIKGGGGCQLQEKIVIANAKQFVIIADYRKDSRTLGTTWTKGVPVEVIPMAYVPVMNKMKTVRAGQPSLRMAQNKAGPVVTDNGNFIVDVKFDTLIRPDELENQLQLIPGVVEVGLFCHLACKAFFGQETGQVLSRVRPSPLS